MNPEDQLYDDDFEESEEDTRIIRIDPKLDSAGWVDKEKTWMIRREKWLTDGRVIPDGKSGKRLKRKRADYVLYYGKDYPIAIVEAKSRFKSSMDGMDQAINYAKMIGVNNRDLSSFIIDLSFSERLIPQIPDGVIAISESGIVTLEDAMRVREAGADAVLIGEALMKKDSPDQFIKGLHTI